MGLLLVVLPPVLVGVAVFVLFGVPEFVLPLSLLPSSLLPSPVGSAASLLFGALISPPEGVEISLVPDEASDDVPSAGGLAARSHRCEHRGRDQQRT